jgi:cytochrome c-type biogenesis protein CcmH/NrfG
LNRSLLTGLIIGVLAGFIGGYFLGVSHPVQSAQTHVHEPQAPGASPAPANPMELQQRAQAAEALVAADPRNLQAWISLGNDYFDLHQPQKAVDAYAKALALDPSNPDVLTDQGVMYRELKAFEKAVACFQKASQLNPRHQPSLFNLGVVYANDLHSPEAARKAWNQTVAIDPASPEGMKARKALEGLS